MKNVEIGLKNRKVKFSDKVEKTQSTKKQEINSLYGLPKDFFSYNRRHETNEVYLD